MNLMPTTVSSSDIQRHYRRVFNQAKTGQKPIVVLTNNQPDVVIVDFKQLEKIYSQAYQYELHQALAAVKDYRRAKKANQLIRAKSLADFQG